MKTLITSLCLLISLSAFSSIDTTIFKSEIKNVTIFFNGAEVIRSGNLNLTKGKHILLIDQLPEMINPQSIQVEGIKNATILSVKHEIAYDNSIQKNPEVKAAKKEIEAIKIRVQRLSNEIDVLRIEEGILLNNSQFTSKEKGANTEELKKAAEFYRERLNSIRNKIIDLNIEVRDSKEKMAENFGKINRVLAKTKNRYSKLIVALECKANLNDELKISYYIPSAGWIPSYDFRVSDINEPLKIVYNANIYQTSGEDWNKVDITLSSNDPSLSGNKPELQPWILGEKQTYLSQNPANQLASQIPAMGGVSSLKGRITEKENGEAVPFANVTLFKNSIQILGTTTDFDGLYTLKPLEPGNYEIQVSYVGYQTKRISGVNIMHDKITIQNVGITEGITLNEVEIIEYSKPLIELDQTTTGYTQKREGLYSSNYEGKKNVRGSRSDKSVTYIDGVKVVGSTNLPRSGVEEVTVNNSYPDYINNSYEYEQTEYKRSKSKNIISNNFSTKTLSLEYEIKIPYSIPSDGKDYNLKIKETNVEAAYEYFIVPKLDKDAFLVAHLNNWEELNLLSGKSSLYFQGKFTGESYINAEQAEDTLTISLGRDKGIFISREQSKELDEKRFYTNDIKETIGWDLVIKNNKNIAVKINLEDQYPISNRKVMEVELLNAEEAINEEKTGKLRWIFNLDPKAKKELSFMYEVKYPKYLDLKVR